MTNDLSAGGIVCQQIHLGGDRNFCYLIGDDHTKEVAAVDPGFEPAQLASLAEMAGLTIRHILVTHGHADHVGGVAELAELTGAGVYAGAADELAGAVPVGAGQCIRVGAQNIQALPTPGHSPGHVCYLMAGFLVTGDILFCGKVGGTGSYFPGSSARQEYDSLQALMRLPADTVVLPGHDYYGGSGTMPHSTIGYEKVHNPFLLAADFDAFCHLKANWAAYKKEHGVR